MDTWVFNIKIDYTRNTKINVKKKKTANRWSGD